MAGKPSVTIAAAYRGLDMGEVVKLVYGNGTFSVADKLDLGLDRQAPRVFSFINTTVNAPQFRVCQANYTWPDRREPGSSEFTFYDASDGWTLKDGPDEYSEPINPSIVINAPVFDGGTGAMVDTSYLLGADCGGSEGGVPGRPDVCVLGMSGDNYGPVPGSAWHYPGPLNEGCFAYCQDLIMVPHQQTIGVAAVLAPRYFALFSICDRGFSVYRASEVYELKFEVINNMPTISTVGTPRLVGKNALSIVPFHAGGNKQNLMLTIPCLGGPPIPGGQARSSLHLISAAVAGTMGTPQQTFEKPDDLDFRAAAYAEDGSAYILCGAQAGGPDEFDWALYQTTTAEIILAASMSPSPELAYEALELDANTHYDSRFWALGMCKPDGCPDEYLIFAKGGVTAPGGRLAQDEIAILKNGETWDTVQIIPAGAMSIQTDYFSINSIDISVSGGGVSPPRSAGRHVINLAGGSRAMKAAPEKLEKESEK